MMSKWMRTAAGIAALVGGLAFASPGVAASMPDAWITTKVKLALLTTEGVSATAVNVDTIDGHVTLHGTVATEQEKTLAGQKAHAVDGVSDVRNLLAVVPASKQDSVKVADDAIKSQVSAALQRDKSLDDSTIEVTSVNAGVVVLSGTAATLSDHVRAVEDAYTVAGVRRVASEVRSPDKLSDAEVWHDTKTMAKSSSEAATGTVSDLWITSAAKVRLMANEQTPALDINIDTRNGAVTLFGMVPSEAAKNAAAAEVRKVDGVTRVDNQLQVVAKSAQSAVKSSDGDVRDRVAERVDDDTIANSDIHVEVSNGVVRLTGTVDSQMDRLRALTLARSTNGVRSVVDELHVEAN